MKSLFDFINEEIRLSKGDLTKIKTNNESQLEFATENGSKVVFIGMNYKREGSFKVITGGHGVEHTYGGFPGEQYGIDLNTGRLLREALEEKIESVWPGDMNKIRGMRIKCLWRDFNQQIEITDEDLEKEDLSSLKERRKEKSDIFNFALKTKLSINDIVEIEKNAKASNKELLISYLKCLKFLEKQF